MVDSNPLDPTAYTTQPLQAPADLTSFGWAPGNYQCVRCDDCGRVFEGAKRCVRCRSCAEKMAAGCAIGNQQSAEGFQLVEGGRSSEGNQSDGEWTIDLIHAHMEHLSPHGDHYDAATLDATGWLLERVEALTAENARLRLDAIHAKTCLRLSPAPDHFDIVCEALAEIKATIDGEGHPGQTVADIVAGCLAEIDALPMGVGDLPEGWYARHRAAVEAAHAAAKEASDPVAEWSGDEHEDVTSRTLRNLSNPEFMAAAFGDDAAKAVGIDMALLSDLCREEPDESTKREVAEMMDKLNGGS